MNQNLCETSYEFESRIANMSRDERIKARFQREKLIKKLAKAIKEAAKRPEAATTGGKWQQSKTGTWHRVGGHSEGENFPECASFNLDRPNPLHGEIRDTPPEGAKICKRCASHK